MLQLIPESVSHRLSMLLSPTTRHLVHTYSVFGIILFLLSGLPNDTSAQSRPHFLADDVSYFWPTNASRYMSSSFGETRAAHFHAAMDIGTWGHEGYAVFAARDGIVHRAAVGPGGYGNVIYLRHDDGTISLYAHLKDFHPRIRSIVDSLRLENYSFEFDKNLESYDIRFRRGQQIGWTGSTGVGPPHLHFELRSPAGNPFNPLLAGLRIDDTIAPRFSGLAIEPLSPKSKINRKVGIYRTRAAFRNGQFDFGEVDVTGEIGLAVDVFDRANASNNVHAVYELEMFVNGERYFHTRADSFSYRESRQMLIDRVSSILSEERKGYQRLYIRDGNTLPFNLNPGRSGRLNLPEGRHNIRIVASDFFGNRSVAVARLHVYDPDAGDPEVQQVAASGKHLPANHVFGAPAKGISAPDGLYWNKNWIRKIRPPHKPEELLNSETLQNPTVSESSGNRQFSIRALGSFKDETRRTLTSGNGIRIDESDRMELQQGDSVWTLHRIPYENPVSVYHENMRISVHFPAETFFEPVTIGITGSYPDVVLFPDTEPFQRPATIRILLDEELRNKKGLGIYRKNARNGNLSHVSSYIDHRSSALIGSISSAGTYTVFADTIAPLITAPKIGKWSHIDLYFVTVHVDDEQSGIDHSSAEFYVNGKRGIAEYDPEKKLLRYHLPTFVPEQSNEITVRISDHAGNQAEETFTDVPYN